MAKRSFYISFGQIHAHRYGDTTLDHDGILEVVASNKADAHKWAMETFEGKFSHVNDEPHLEYYPRGIVKIVHI